MNQTYPTQAEIEAYVLGLLSPADEARFSARLQVDAQLRQAVRAERRIGRLVRGTLQAANRTNPTRIRKMMPPPPRQHRWTLPARWAQQAAGLTLMLLLAFGIGYGIRSTDTWQPQPGGIAATATQTSIPTATATATKTAQSTEYLRLNLSYANAPQPLATPKAAGAHFANE